MLTSLARSSTVALSQLKLMVLASYPPWSSKQVDEIVEFMKNAVAALWMNDRFLHQGTDQFVSHIYSLKVPLNYYDPGKPCLFQPPGIYHYHRQVVLWSHWHCTILPPPILTHIFSSSKKHCCHNCMYNYRLLFIPGHDIHFRSRPHWTSNWSSLSCQTQSGYLTEIPQKLQPALPDG
jgi:hypothetical protein